MGLSSWWARRAIRATRVLVVEGGDGFAVRVEIEREVLARGWRLADSPATADALVVVGRAAGELADVVERVWEAMPGPRARGTVLPGGEVAGILDDLAAHLADRAEQALDAAGRTAPDLASGDEGAGHGEMEHGGHEGSGGTDHGGMDHEGMDHEGMDHEGMDHEGMDHESMDHEGMDMAPDGIPLAEGAEDDRDGLEMDALPVRLGPVLPHWPAGLVLDLTLHGDLVAEATARLVDAGSEGGASETESPATRAARRSDDVAAVLALAGWQQGAGLARAARDALLSRRGDDARALLVDLRHRVEHSRLLRWSLRGVGVVPVERAAVLGLPPELAGDCRDRLVVLVGRAVAAAEVYAGTTDAPEQVSPVVPVEALGRLLEGCDLAGARLVVASVGTPVSAGVGARA